MSPEDVLHALLDRLGATDGAAVLISDHELSQWPAVTVTALKAHKLIAKASPAASVVCPGCEDECVMPVHLVNYPTGRAAFIACDRRSDVGRIPVPVVLLVQWQCTIDSLSGFIADNLNVHRRTNGPVNAEGWEIGIARGHKRSQMLCLKAEGELRLIAGGRAMPLTALIGYHDGAYAIDGAMIHQLVDAATTADPRYTPSNARREVGKLETQAMHDGWRKAYRALRHKKPDQSDVWYARQIAKMDIARGRSADTIRKNMKN
jgi:hypothetical protein